MKLFVGPVTVMAPLYVPSPDGTSEALTFTATVAEPDAASIPSPGLADSHAVPSVATDQPAAQLAGLKMMNELAPPGATLRKVVFE